MGQHNCEYCDGEIKREHVYLPSSSGDVILDFPNGDTFIIPDGILHYVFDHDYMPPEEFVADVMRFHPTKVKAKRNQTRGIASPAVRIGYLTGPFPTGEVSVEFKMRLVQLIETAAKDYLENVLPKSRRKNYALRGD